MEALNIKEGEKVPQKYFEAVKKEFIQGHMGKERRG